MTEGEIELLPCPFCGKPANMWKFPTTQGQWGVECMSSSRKPCVSLPACFATEDDAIGAWNTRAAIRDSNKELLTKFEKIKLLVVGDISPCWVDTYTTSMTRMSIANICDEALARHGEKKGSPI